MSGKMQPGGEVFPRGCEVEVQRTGSAKLSSRAPGRRDSAVVDCGGPVGGWRRAQAKAETTSEHTMSVRWGSMVSVCSGSFDASLPADLAVFTSTSRQRDATTRLETLDVSSLISRV